MNENNWVVKSNALIESKGRMSALERKIILGLISEIGTNDKDFQDYVLDISELGKQVGTKAKDFYADVENACKSLASRNITIRENFEEKGKTKTRVKIMSYLAYAEYVVGGNAVKVQIAPALVPYLLELKSEFTQYQLKNVLSMTSTHAIKIYELLKQYERIGKRTFELDELKSYLGIEEKYSVFKDFEKRVLKVAIDEINEKTDLSVSYTKKRTGRKIGIIEFDIKSPIGDAKTENEKALADLYDFDALKAKMGLSDARFSNEQVMELYELACEHADEVVSPHEYVRLNYNHAISKNPKSLFAYLKKALKDDYALANLHVKLEYYEGE